MSTVAWSHLPRFSAAGRECVRALRESVSVNPVCEAGEDWLAAWLWLLVRSGHLAPGDIDRALARGDGWHGLLSLARRGGEQLVDDMAQTATQAVPKDVAEASSGWWLGLRVPMQCNGEIPQIQLVGCAVLDVTIDFTALPPELAAAVLETLWLIRAMVPMGLGAELFEQSPWACERRWDYEQLGEAGLLDDPVGALELVKRGELSALDASDVAEMTDLLADAPNWLDADRYWPGMPNPGRPNERAERLLALTARWRAEKNELHRHRWVRFIERVAEYMRGQDDLPEWFHQRPAVLPLDYMETDLSVLCFVLGGNPAEAQMVDEDREMISQGGEEAVASLAMDAAHREDVWPLLQDVAIASGWLVWAEGLAND